MSLVTTYQQVFESIFFECFGHDVEVLDFTMASAGIINTGTKVVTSEGLFFVKMNELPVTDFFWQEAENLKFLSRWLSTPQVVGWGKTQGYQYLVCAFIPEGEANAKSWSEAGALMANLHRQTADSYGFAENNYLVATPQDNQPKTDGIDFLVQNRIIPMMGYCLMEEKISISLYKKIEALCARLSRIIPNEKPALLHGDLWTGNLIFGSEGKPVFIDPAVYYGYRESELAFTYLFGGFDPAFYEAYLHIFPLEPGFGERVSIYHIHPLLVHVYYFGPSYIVGLERIINRFS